MNYLLYVKEFKVTGNSLQGFPRLNSLSFNATIMVSKKNCSIIGEDVVIRLPVIIGSPMTGHLNETKIVFSLNKHR